MTKTELMETYTAEQLAEMALAGEQIGENLIDIITRGNKKIPVVFDKISRVETEGREDENHKKTLIEKYQEEINEWKKNHPYNIDERLEAQKLIKEIRRDERGIWLNMKDADFIQNYSKMQKTIFDNQSEIAKLNCEVEKYRKAFEDAKKECDCQIAEYQKKIEELKVENAELHCEMQAMKVLPDEIPTEPIKVAEMLINAEGEYEHNPLAKAFCGTDKGTYRIFAVPELRQIAEHLFVYCNHNGEAEE